MLIHILKAALITLIWLLAAAAEADVVIKLATVAPKDSIWHESLKRIDGEKNEDQTPQT